MTVLLTTGLCVIVSALILTTFSTILPYWTYVVLNDVTYHDGLWRNCTVYTDKFDCRNVQHVRGWFHAVQCMMVAGIVVLFVAMVSGCVYHSNETRWNCRVLSTCSCLLGGIMLTTGIIVYGVENRGKSDSFSAGFYLSIVSACLTIFATALVAFSTRPRGYIHLT